MSSRAIPKNAFLSASIGPLFAKTALPIILVMSMSGLLNVIDAIFLGLYVGRDAVSAVSVIFPMIMVLIAVSTLVTTGMSSLLARRLGAGALDDARAVFASAHGLAIAASLLLMGAFALVGRGLIIRAAAGDPTIAQMAHVYMAISVGAVPMMMMLSIHSDGLRNEGRAPMMAALSLLVSLANIGFNYLLIVVFEMGVAGSAWGTVAAQMLALGLTAVFRLRGATPLPLSLLRHHRWWGGWGRMLTLGAPQSLSFLGIALVSGTVIATVQASGGDGYAATIGAYGIITRIFGLMFLPLLGLSLAMQSIVGNNVGAQAYGRSDAALRYALITSLVYCVIVEGILLLFAPVIGAGFIKDAEVIAEVARILPQMVLLYVFAGPVLMLSAYFQALGDAPRAAVLSMAKPFLLTPALILGLSAAAGEPGIWMAPPFADGLLAIVAALLLWRAAARTDRRMGVFLGARAPA